MDTIKEEFLIKEIKQKLKLLNRYSRAGVIKNDDTIDTIIKLEKLAKKLHFSDILGRDLINDYIYTEIGTTINNNDDLFEDIYNILNNIENYNSDYKVLENYVDV